MQWLPKNNSVKLNLPVKSCTMSFGFLQMNHTEIQVGNFATAILHEITSNLHGFLELLIKLPPKNPTLSCLPCRMPFKHRQWVVSDLFQSVTHFFLFKVIS